MSNMADVEMSKQWNRLTFIVDLIPYSVWPRMGTNQAKFDEDDGDLRRFK